MPFAPPSACVVLVPVGGTLDPACDDALRDLERRGHPVWRVRGYSAVDAARNQLATDALAVEEPATAPTCPKVRRPRDRGVLTAPR
jgi:hypothetical protein